MSNCKELILMIPFVTLLVIFFAQPIAWIIRKNIDDKKLDKDKEGSV